MNKQTNQYITEFEQFQTYVKDILSEEFLKIYNKYKQSPVHADSFDKISEMYNKLLTKYETKINEEIDKLFISQDERKRAEKYVKEVLSNLIIYVEQSASIDIEFAGKRSIFKPFSRSAAKELTMTKELDENGNYIVKYVPKNSNTVYITDAEGKTLGVTGKELSAAAAKELYNQGYNIRYFDDKKVASKVKTDCQIKSNPYYSDIISFVEHLNNYEKNKEHRQDW